MKRNNISFKVKASELIKSIQKSQSSGELIKISLNDVIDLSIHEEPKIITPDDYCNFEELIKKYDINLKDMREVIMMANSWWTVGPCSDQEMVDNYLDNKDKFRDKVYSWELISLVLNGLSSCKNPVTDFYSRIIRTNPEKYNTFEEFLKRVYEIKK